MIVIGRWALGEDNLRRIRAANGKGGVATRAEALAFMQLAVRKALEAAPEPKAPRGGPKVVPDVAVVVPSAPAPEPLPELQKAYKTLGVGRFAPSGDESTEAAVEQRERIKQSYDV